MTERQQRLCVWTGISFTPVFLVGFAVVAGFIPPPSPHMTADAVRRRFLADHDRIRIGNWIATAAAPLLAFYVAAITHQIRRIAGAHAARDRAADRRLLPHPRVLFPQLAWQTAAYRARRCAETVQTLNDLAWLPYVGIVGTAMAQMAIVALVVLS
jgi:hypothetical protein